jgi:hypothetical protein
VALADGVEVPVVTWMEVRVAQSTLGLGGGCDRFGGRLRVAAGQVDAVETLVLETGVEQILTVDGEVAAAVLVDESAHVVVVGRDRRSEVVARLIARDRTVVGQDDTAAVLARATFQPVGGAVVQLEVSEVDVARGHVAARQRRRPRAVRSRHTSPSAGPRLNLSGSATHQR